MSSSEEKLFFEAALTALARALHTEGAMDMRTFVVELRGASDAAKKVGMEDTSQQLSEYAERMSRSCPPLDS